MKGYIYTLYAGADPGKGWLMNDPIFGKAPTLGACVPNIRRLVEKGDWIYSISGRVTAVQQYVVGGFQVEEKISSLDAYARFPENRIQGLPDGSVSGNIIVDASGARAADDNHSNFEKRLDNYIVGGDSKCIESPTEIARAREETLPILSDLFGKQGNRVYDVVARWRKLDEEQINTLNAWLDDIKRGK